jgi:hypothetical protein
VFMTIRFGGDGDAVFLFWDPKSEKFIRKCYAQFHKRFGFGLGYNIFFKLNFNFSLNFNVEFGKWFELKYLDVPGNELHIIVFDYEEIRPRAVTRVRDNLCAQVDSQFHQFFLNNFYSSFPLIAIDLSMFGTQLFHAKRRIIMQRIKDGGHGCAENVSHLCENLVHQQFWN